jgi:hypothetical protein
MIEQYPQMVQFIGIGVTIQTESPVNFVAAGGTNSLLLESADHILLENSDTLQLES